MRYIKGLDTVGATDLELVGGKGANLGELVLAGLPVPSGHVLTTEAYRAFVAANGLQERILDLAKAPQDKRADAAMSIAAMFAAGTIPADMADELRESYLATGLRQRRRTGRRAFLRHCRGPGGGQFRRATRHLPECHWHRGPAGCGP